MIKRTATAMALALAIAATPAFAQGEAVELNDSGYFEGPALNYLVFSNYYDGLFADSKISGVEIVQQGERIATNGDVRLDPTPGQWDPVGLLVDRTVDPATGTISATLEYADLGFRYIIRARPEGTALMLSVELPQPLPAQLVGKAGFNLEFMPASYMRESYYADGKAGGFPLYPSSGMVSTPERNAASGRSDGPGAQPVELASGRNFVLAPSDPALRVAVSSDTPIALYDGRNIAQNGWFVLRSLLPAGRTGTVLEWTVAGTSVPGWLRDPVIAHSQLGYVPGQAKVATIELDRADRRGGQARLLRIGTDGQESVAKAGTPVRWGEYLRYNYARFDFTDVRDPGLYVLEYGGTRTAPFRIDPQLHAAAWQPTLDVFFPVQMDHMLVNEAYRVWHGASHLDDARQAPVDHEHFDLYAQGPTTDTKFAPGEHIPGLAIGGWYDAGDFDIRTQTQYQVVRSLVRSQERFAIARDTTSVDDASRRVEIHVPDGKPDLLQQIRHGTLQLVAQFDAVGHAINGIVEPDIGQYTHLGDAGSKTDGKIFDPSLQPYRTRGERSGTPDDRWAFTSESSALNYGSIAALAAASRVLGPIDAALASKSLKIAQRIWAMEQAREPVIFRHGNTTGGPLESERFAAAVELLKATGDAAYGQAVAADLAAVTSDAGFDALTATDALDHMPPSYREAMLPAVRAWAERSKEALAANPFGVPITEGGWAGSGTVLNFGLSADALHRAFPDIVGPEPVFRALDFVLGHHPGSDISFVSGVGSRSKEVAYGNNRADYSFIAGGVVPGVLVLKPDLPENREDWPFFWGQNEYVIPEGADYIALVHAAQALAQQGGD